MSAYEALLAQAAAAVEDLDAQVVTKKQTIERLKHEIVGMQLERRKLAALLPTNAAPARQSPALASPATGTLVCECGREFGRPQALGRHRTSGSCTGAPSSSESGPEVEPDPTPVIEHVAVVEEDPAGLAADVVKLWGRWKDRTPSERARAIAEAVGITSAQVRGIVREAGLLGVGAA